MFNRIVFLVFFLFYCNPVNSQNGQSINFLQRDFNTSYDGNFKNHSSIVSLFEESHADSCSLYSIKPLADVQFYLDPFKKINFQGREGGIVSFLNNRKISGVISIVHQLSFFPSFISEEIDSNGIIPHNHNLFYNKNDFYSWFNLYGNISFSPYKFLQLELGHDKHFLGNGYRSLFLSDNSGAYSYLSASLKIWHLKYLSLTTRMRDIYYNKNNQLLFKPKFTSIHYISWNITPSVNLNLFETVVWRGNDSVLFNGLNINYLNPVVFMRPIEYAQASVDNSLLGLGLNFILLKNTQLYSQVVLDEFFIREITNPGYRDNKYGYQIGLRGRIERYLKFSWLIEHNLVRPFTYSHYHTLQNYGNLLQPLAHPFGANFKEYITRFSASKNRLYATLHLSYAILGKDGNEELHGNNIYENYWDVDRFGHYLLDGIKSEKYNMQLTTGYLIKPEWNMSVETGIVFQKENSELNATGYNYFFIGLKTLLYNDHWFE